MSEPDYAKAHTDLSKAISAYYETITGEYVAAWVLVTHKLSADMEAEGTSAIGVITARDQAWVLSRGMLEIARENDSFSGYQEYEFDDDE